MVTTRTPKAAAKTVKAPAKAAAKTTGAKPAVKPATAAAVTAPVTPPKSPAAGPAAPAKAAPSKAAPPKAAAKPKAEKPAKVKKPKLVRDSFTIPKTEYVVLDELKTRATGLGRAVKKSELLRAGIKALAAMSDAALTSALANVPAIKTGRPKKEAPAKA